ncbi:hypothetical protein [Vagococcus xieshaowenii]|uniref:Uncharacterized protein n=1 Tax=Vagococcus xieshaowenii TaxID=2562451 RepID=A0A4Z0D178_9ENTE|nr:hypothetical protein [Vagococcus xieshaowenii]QCA28941.1 hypothetical protein E4Z98_06280 [Vagococcus xieshaowenii]TFZ39247.1 hypothetical protein E4031_09585 [Vagococcus xieshaowenii]
MEKTTMKHQVKQLTQIISSSSQRFLASFFDDSLITKKELEKIKEQLIKASTLKATTVLQVSESVTKRATTMYGQVMFQPTNETTVILKDEQTQSLHMLPIKHIRKVSYIEPQHSKIS